MPFSNQSIYTVQLLVDFSHNTNYNNNSKLPRKDETEDFSFQSFLMDDGKHD